MPLSRALATGLLGTLAFTSLAAQERTTIGGYGEAHYTNATGPNTPGQVNLKRFVVYLAHTFNDRLAFRSELEVEDAKVEGGRGGGEVGIEQAYLDYRLKDWLTLRTGLVLVPIGIINETHEPPTFNGVERPAFENDVIPTTWREIGIGALGTVPGVAGLSYRLYLLNGLKAEGLVADGIREARQEGQDASFANPSLTGRLEWARPGLKIGGSFWYGGTANEDSVIGRGINAAPITLVAADARYEVGGATFRAVVATIGLNDVDAAAITFRYSTNVGTRMTGGYIEAAYNILTPLTHSSQQLNAFIRVERYDTQAAVPAGTVQDPTLARRITTVGLSYKPTYNTVFKGDYQLLHNRSGMNEVEVLSLGIGYQF